MGLVDLVMKPVEPTPADEPRGTVESIVDGVWQIERRMEFLLGMGMPCRTTILEYGDGALMIHAPVAVPESLYREVEELGEVSAIVAPNSFHHAFVADWRERFPRATVYASTGLSARGIEISDAVDLTDRPPASWQSTIEQVEIAPNDRHREVVFYHRPTGTLLLTDLAFGGIPQGAAWTRWAWRVYGISPGFGPSRIVRATILADGDEVREKMAEILDWDVRRICLCHGTPVEREPRETFRRAFRDVL